MAGRLLEGATATGGWSGFASGKRIAGSVKGFFDRLATRFPDGGTNSGPS
jgi:hypothetical protein